MSGLPTGTVTFLFTDIEGSTRLLRRLGERYAEVLGRHDRLVRAACAGHGGREMNTLGDAFFVAFARASDAVAAAVQVQRALAAEQWPEGAGVSVRMGLHTGEPVLGGADYVGLDVHRAARICAAGHGGQVLISRPTRELIADDLSPDVVLKDLGEHRLKDLDRPEHLFQLVVGGLPPDFPPPASSPAPAGAPDALPPAPNRTVGREDDVRAIAARLRAGDVRLLTLTGTGGVGKTRLAVEAARAVQADFAEGARLVWLAGLRRGEDVPSAILHALAVAPIAGESPEQAVMRFLAAKGLLLVLDNLEQLLPAARFVSDLLTACPALTVLATSREPLGLRAEQRHPVAPLALPELGTPEDADTLAGVAAVVLFVDRARAHDPGFHLRPANAAAIAEICRRVDGLPLAIELAAARCALLSPGEIAERLDAALGALGSGAHDAPARQQTLRATIDWSHELLSATEQEAFARFAVFAGGATVQASEAITGATLETLDGLVAKSLLVRLQPADTPTRLGMLETIRAYAAERFAHLPDTDAVRERHYRHYLALAQRHGAHQALWAASREEHLAHLDAEIENLHAALGWAVGQDRAEPALVLCAALGWYWLMRDRYADAVDWIDRALSLPGADVHPALRVRALCIKSWGLWPLGRAAEQSAAIAEAEADARALGDPVILSQVLQARSSHESSGARRLDVAEAFADEALALASTAGDDWTTAMAAFAKAMAASSDAELRERVGRAASLLESVGNVYHLADLLSSAAYVALCLGSDRDAKEFADRAIPIARELDNPYTWMMLRGNFGLAALLTGDTDAARGAFCEELELCRELVVRPFASEGLLGLAAVAAIDGDADRAARLAGAAAAHLYGQPHEVMRARIDAAFLDAARARCGVDAWDAAAREGAALSFGDAISYALGERRA
jgi:predicted ATPase/class 3 adenylate cyclase